MNIQLGRHSASLNSPSWRLDTGSGTRKSDYYVKFPKPYKRKPEVEVALNILDVRKEHNTRINVYVTQIGREGFIVRYQTWADTRIPYCGVTWTAVGNPLLCGDEIEPDALDMAGVEVFEETDPDFDE